jgi:hypothetical protein
VIAQNGMVCTSHPLAGQAALDILKKGGTAIDAAIAANACLGLMEPTGCGIGRRPVCHRVGCQNPKTARPERQWAQPEIPHAGVLPGKKA